MAEETVEIKESIDVKSEVEASTKTDLVDWEALYKQRQEERKEQIEFSTNRVKITQSGKFKTPDDREGSALQVVVVDFTSVNLFFDRPFDRDNPIPPACFAINKNPRKLVPSKNSPAVQSESCAICPMNEYQSATVGRGKACKNTRLLAIVPAHSPKDPIWTISIPPASIKYWDKYVSQVMAEQGLDVSQVITEISQDEKQSFAAPRFRAVGVIPVNELADYGRRFEEAAAELEREPNVEEYEPPQQKGKK